MKKFLKNKSQPFARGISTDYSAEETKPRNFVMNTLSSEKEEQNGYEEVKPSHCYSVRISKSQEKAQ